MGSLLHPFRELKILILVTERTWNTFLKRHDLSLSHKYTCREIAAIGSYDDRFIEAKAREARKDDLRACPHDAQLISRGST